MFDDLNYMFKKSLSAHSGPIITVQEFCRGESFAGLVAGLLQDIENERELSPKQLKDEEVMRKIKKKHRNDREELPPIEINPKKQQGIKEITDYVQQLDKRLDDLQQFKKVVQDEPKIDLLKKRFEGNKAI